MTTIRILVAEDNEDHRFFIKRALRREATHDLTVTTVKDGAEAMAFLRQEAPFEDVERPHLIILDIKMPRMDGHQVLAQVKSDERLRRIPVAVLSSSDRSEDVETAYGLGGNSYVIKQAADGLLADGLRGLRDFWTDVAVLPDPAA